MNKAMLVIFLCLVGLSAAPKNENEIVKTREMYNANIKDLINYIMDITGYSISYTDLPADRRISIPASESITVKELMGNFASELLSIGFSLEKKGSMYRVYKLQDVDSAEDIFTDIEKVKSIQNRARIIIFLKSIRQVKGEAILAQLRQHLSASGNISFIETAGKILIKDLVEKIILINTLIDELDTSGETGNIIKEFMLKHVSADRAILAVSATIPGLVTDDTRYPASRRVSPYQQQQENFLRLFRLDRNDAIYLSGPQKTAERTAENILQILAMIDKPAIAGESANYEIVKLNILGSDELMEILNRITGKNDSRRPYPQDENKAAFKFKGQVDLIPSPSKTYILLIGDETDRALIRKIISDIENNLGTEKITAASPVFRVYPVLYSKSEDITAMLNNLKTPSAAGETLFSPDTVIINYPQQNSVLIKAPLQKIQAIEEIIKKLDVRSTQVLVEVKVIEFSYDNSRKLGIDYSFPALKNLTALAGKLDISLKGLAAKGIFSGLSPDSASANNPGAFFWHNDSSFIVGALGEIGDVNIISTPNLLTLNNKPAKIVIADKKAIQKEELQIAQSGSTSSDKVLITHEYKEAGISLTITPHVNDDRNVTLELKQEINDFKETSTSGFPDIATRSIETELVVAHKTTAILGGLIQDKKVSTERGIPGLMRIPGLGVLFRRTQTVTRKVELLIFLTPYILSSDEDLKEISSRKLLDSAYQTMQHKKLPLKERIALRRQERKEKKLKKE